MTACFTLEGTLSEANDLFLQTFKATREHFSHREFFEDQKVEQKLWQEVCAGTKISGNFNYQLSEKQPGNIFATYIPIADQQNFLTNIYWVGISQEVATRKDLFEISPILSLVERNFIYAILDPKGQIVHANDNFHLSINAKQTDLIGSGIRDFTLVTSETGQSIQFEDLIIQLSVGNTMDGEYWLSNSNGERVWFKGTFDPVLDEDGTLSSIVHIANVTTQEKSSKIASREVLETVNLSFGMIRFDPLGNILQANQRFCQLMEYHKDELIGNHHSLVVDEAYANSAEYQDFWEELRNGTAQKGEFERISKTGKKIFIQAAYTPLTDDRGKVYAIVKIAANITDAKQALIQSKEELKDEILLNVSEISTAISQISVGARSQAQKTDQVFSGVESAIDSANNVARNAKEITAIAEEAAQNSKKGEQTIIDLAENVTNIDSFSKQTQLSMNDLSKNVDKISSVLKIMKEFSSQTNLLSLNASIEAAQAGESGRGFAVIAEEIRKLAESTSSSTDQVEELAFLVQKGSKNVVESLLKMMDKVKEGLLATSEAKNAFSSIIATTNQTFDSTNSILKLAKNQEEMIKGIAKDIETMVVISEETASASEEVSSAAKTLQDKMEDF